MKHSTLFLMLVAICATAFGQTERIVPESYVPHDMENLTGEWSDGIFVWNVRMEGNAALFSNAINGGFYLEKQMDDSEYPWRYKDYDPTTNNGARLMEFSNDGWTERVVLIYDDQGKPMHSYRFCHDAVPVGKEVMSPFFGQYIDQQGREAWIGAERITLPGLSGTYSMHWVYEAPEPVAMVDVDGKEKALYLKLTLNGVDIHEAVNDDFESNATDSSPGRLLYRLRYNSAIPRWMPMTSERVLTRGELLFVSGDILAVMRNLPYAMRGYKFSRKALRDYFEAQSWYRAAESNDGITLTKFEYINVELIKISE